MFRVLAKKPEVFTLDPLVKRMPLELIRKTLPVALRAPWMILLSLPTTLFKVMA